MIQTRLPEIRDELMRRRSATSRTRGAISGRCTAAADTRTSCRVGQTALIGLERQAFGLAELQDPTPPETATVVTPNEEALAKFRERAALRMNPTE